MKIREFNSKIQAPEGHNAMVNALDRFARSYEAKSEKRPVFALWGIWGDGFSPEAS